MTTTAAPLPTPLISAQALAALLAGPEATRPQVLDASFDLADTGAGRRAWVDQRVPGSLYLHLDEVLSGPKTGLTGRHPLPEPALLAQRLATLGIDGQRPLVALDRTGAMYAARLWWMLRWLGLGPVAVLDGGLAAWQAAGLPLAQGEPADAPTPVPAWAPGPAALRTVDFATLRAQVQASGSAQPGAAAAPGLLVVDARAADRFRGENETLDPVGGHIPGARNRFFRLNLQADGRFKPAEVLRSEWSAVLGGADPAQVVHQCGSGVTACHNLLALAAAGLPDGQLYPGSWSEWSAQPGAPVATGEG